MAADRGSEYRESEEDETEMISQAELVTALFEHAKNMSLGLHVVLPREAYKPSEGEIYLDVSWLPNETVELFTGNDAAAWYQGILQIAVMTPAETSIVDASVVVDDVIAYWPKGSAIDAGNFRVKIQRQPWPSPSFRDESWDRVPISIEYKVIA
jgi:hypothetical protein